MGFFEKLFGGHHGGGSHGGGHGGSHGGHHGSRGTNYENGAPPVGNNGGISCRNCAALNVPTARFCLQCGTSVTPAAQCTQCGNAVQAGSRFCGQCGKAAA